MSLAALLIPLAFQLSGASVTGRVTDASSGEPIRHVLVRLGDAGLESVTDASGSFLLALVPPGIQPIYDSSIGYGLVKLEIEIRGEEGLELDLRLGQEAKPGRATVVGRGVHATIAPESVTVTAPVFEEVERSGVSPR